MEKFHGFKGKGVIAQHVARADEMLVNYQLCLDALDELDTSASARADYDPRGTGKLGIGVSFQNPPTIRGVSVRDLLKLESHQEMDEELNPRMKELAEKLNVTDKAVSKWERGVPHS